jgi:molybdate transport system ATP-binding protein
VSLELDLEVARGDFCLRVQATLDAPCTGVIGPSGSGKTTLLQALAGLVPSKGRIVCGGEVWLDGQRATPPEQRRVGYVFQDGRLFPHLDVRGNLSFGQREGIPLERVVEVLELNPLLARRVRGLSGGERQRVALGRALLTAPRLLLLDEPTAGLDRARARRVIELVARVGEAFSLPTLYVGHDLSEVLTLTDHLLVLRAGQLVGAGPVDELAARPEAMELAVELGLDNALRVVVGSHDEAAGVTRARCGDAAVSLPLRSSIESGAEWVVHLRPEDIILAAAEGVLPPLSARNCLPGAVRRVVPLEAGHVLIEIEGEAGLLRAHVTAGAQADLGLSQGARVRCLFKSTALRWGSTRP